jgi:hypothetical protein
MNQAVFMGRIPQNDQKSASQHAEMNSSASDAAQFLSYSGAAGGKIRSRLSVLRQMEGV